MSEPQSVPQPENKGFLAVLNGPQRSFTPLYFISVVVVLIDAILVIGGSWTNGWVQGVFVILIAITVIGLVGGFFLIIWFKPLNLYSPSELPSNTTMKELTEGYYYRNECPDLTNQSETMILGGQISVGELITDPIEDQKNLGTLSPDASDEEASWSMKLYAEIQAETMDFVKAEEAFRHLKLEEEDQKRIFELELIYVYSRLTHGDGDALQRLEDMAKNAIDQDQAADAYVFVGLSYQLLASHLDVEEPLLKAIELTSKQSVKSRAITLLATSRFRRGETQFARQILEGATRSLTNRGAISTVYQGLSEYFDELDEPLPKALALEKALENKPQDTRLRFEAARAFSAVDYDAISLIHYSTIITMAPQNSGAYNNLGVDYTTLEMPTKAVEAYQKSYELGETLAASNLAYQYMNAGFLGDAAKILDEARTKPDVDPNVGRATAALDARKTRDEEREETETKKAREQRVFFSGYADALFTPTPAALPFNGAWLSDEGYIANIVQDGSDISGSWVSGKKLYKFKGTASKGTAAIEEISGRDPDIAYYYGMDEKILSKGDAFVSLDGRTLTIMGVLSGNMKFLKFQNAH